MTCGFVPGHRSCLQRVLPVSFGNQFLHLRVGEAVCQGNEPEIPGNHLAGDRLDLAPGRIELVRQGIELFRGHPGERMQGCEAARALRPGPLT
jgi:hypothetical protein